MTIVSALPSLLTKKETAQALKISLATLQRWMNAGILVPVKIGPRGLCRFKLHEILALIEEGAKK